MVRFPHTIKYNLPGTPGEMVDGDWIPGTEGAEVSEPCRAQPNVRSEYITKESDGSRTDFSFSVYMSRDVAKVEAGQTVTVEGSEGVIITGTVTRFHKGQLHSVLWV